MASSRLESWDDYRDALRQFDAILEHSKAVSRALVGKDFPSERALYAEQIFVKALSHCLIVRYLAPDPSRTRVNELWDVPSISAVARCVIEAHDAFFYISAVGCSEQEALFRLMLWEAHDKTRRARMLDAIGSRDPRNEKMNTEAAALVSELTRHPVFPSLRRDIQKKIRQGDPPAFHISQRELCIAASIDYDYYVAVTMQLSQYVHTYPFSVRQLFAFKAGELDSLRLMALPVQFTIPFITRIAEGIRQQFPGQTPEPPSRTAQAMLLWRSISTTGIKGF